MSWQAQHPIPEIGVLTERRHVVRNFEYRNLIGYKPQHLRARLLLVGRRRRAKRQPGRHDGVRHLKPVVTDELRHLLRPDAQDGRPGIQLPAAQENRAQGSASLYASAEPVTKLAQRQQYFDAAIAFQPGRSTQGREYAERMTINAATCWV